MTTSTTRPVTTAELVDTLRDALEGSTVSTDDALLDALGHDAWPVSVVAARRGLHPTRPEAAVMARSEEDVATVLREAAAAGVPVVARGLGSSVTGQPLPTRGGVVLDLEELVGEPELDETDLTVTVPAGYNGGRLETWLGERGYTLNHYPQSLHRSSVGGWLATRATGQLSAKYGGIEQLVAAYRVALTDGTLVDVHSRPRAAVGPDMRQLFLGSEGAFGVVVRVTLRVFRTSALSTVAYVLPDVPAGLAAMREIVQRGLRPALVRFYDEDETRHAVPGETVDGCALFLGFDGPAEVAAAEERAAAAVVEELGGTSIGSAPVEAWLGRRFDFSTVERYLAAEGGYAETVEVAHLWSGVQGLYDDLREALSPLADEVLMHFSHVYDQGVSLYVILLGHAADDAAAAERLDRIWAVAMETTVAAGGELSHHHGAGLARQEYIPRSLGSQHRLLGVIKHALDPQGILNPGKLGL